MSRQFEGYSDPAERQEYFARERTRHAQEAARVQREIAQREAGLRASLLPKVAQHDVEGMRRFVDSLARQFHISFEFRTDLNRLGVSGFADRRRRCAVIRPIVDGETFAVALHEAGHLVSPDCTPGTDGHQPNPQVTNWLHCVRCEEAAWRRALTFAPFTRSMFAELRGGLSAYRRSTPAPRDVEAKADVLMKKLTYAEHRQRHLKMMMRQEQQARVMREVQRRSVNGY
jgi:hypothetical protein